MGTPSTNWQENVGSDEAQVFERMRQVMSRIQKDNSAKRGKGRGLHRKSPLALPALLEVQDGLPAHARHGLFARPGSYETWLRLSNGAPGIQSDRIRDVRGLAIKVRGVKGAGALGEPTDCQDFLLINLPAFAFPTPDEFIGLVEARVAGGSALFRYMARTYGVLGMFRELRRLGKSMARPFHGFASSPLFSAAPIACGPYAARVRLLPSATGTTPRNAADWGDDLCRHVAERELRFDLQLQFFVDEEQTPIENAAVDWPESVSPYLSVATLIIPQGAARARADAAFTAQVEAEAFDPWKALAEHRPLGRVMRARKVVYFDSFKGRT